MVLTFVDLKVLSETDKHVNNKLKITNCGKCHEENKQDTMLKITGVEEETHSIV